MNQLIITSDGSHTLYVPELDEHFHSIHGAIQESSYIFIGNGFDFCNADPVNIFEVGFGTGLNALLTALKCINLKKPVNYTSIEKYPLDKETINSLNYPQFTGINGRKIFDQLHLSPWNSNERIDNYFTLTKIFADFTSYVPDGQFDLIYFDAFAPDKQPEMWTKKLFDKISGITVKNGILVTYSAKGEVRRILNSCGFDVSLIPGPPGKRQIIRAIKK